MARGHARRPRHPVQAEINDITSPRWVSRVLQATLTGTRPASLRLSWRIDRRATPHLPFSFLRYCGLSLW
jgi:hypothetical protein